MSERLSVLVTGLGGLVARQVALSLVEAGRFRVIGCDSDRFKPFLYQSREIEDIRIVPPVSDARYVAAFNELCRAENIALVAATGEAEVEALKAAGDAITAPLFLPSLAHFNMFHSKWLTYQALTETDEGLVPRTMMLMAENDIDRALELYGSPIWIRGCIGQAAETAYCARDAQSGKAWLQLRAGYGAYTASEFLPGRNLAWTALYDQDELICSTVHERVSYFNAAAAPSGVTGVASVSRTLHDEAVCKVGARAIEAVGRAIADPLSGIVTLDMKEAADGSAKVTEINPRPTNTLHLTRAGCNFAAALVDVALGGRPDYALHNACRADVYYLRDIDCLPIILDKADLLKPLD